jgi:glutamine---fructose-6-phosphate transaminase (isomerizing)
MCGVTGFLGNCDYKDYIINGLLMVQNRGYDSAGITYMDDDGELHTFKMASTNTNNALTCLKDIIYEENATSRCAIGHTRWATHGPKTDINAHPHLNTDGTISLIHNGIIENYLELKSQYLGDYNFISETDTEVIVALIDYWCKKDNLNIHDSVKKTTALLKGTWALVIISRLEPNKMWLTRNGSPLLLSTTESSAFVVSESLCFTQSSNNKYIVLDDNSLIEVSFTDGIINLNIDVSKHIVKTKSEQFHELSPEPYSHWMIKEILEQDKSSNYSLNNGARINGDKIHLGGLREHKDLLLGIEHLILLGCGTSYNAGLWSLTLFKQSRKFTTVSIVDGSEFSEYDIPNYDREKIGFILLSQSGETRDLVRCLELLNNKYITIGVVNVVDSLIARETLCGVYLNAGREVAVASTKSFTCQCIVLAMIAVWFLNDSSSSIIANWRKLVIENLLRLPRQIKEITENLDDVKHLCDIITPETKSCFVLGKGPSEAIARETSLKLKEIAYMHAEGFSSTALKHGPFALIVDKLPVFILNCEPYNHDKNMNALQEVLARNAFVILIGHEQVDNVFNLQIPPNEIFSGVIGNVYLQALSYYMALKQDINPDFPRNLAKVVTVE